MGSLAALALTGTAVLLAAQSWMLMRTGKRLLILGDALMDMVKVMSSERRVDPGTTNTCADAELPSKETDVR